MFNFISTSEQISNLIQENEALKEANKDLEDALVELASIIPQSNTEEATNNG
ncbi:MAG: hypothetical protein Q8876_03820 [Bacillota bacterium]|nr:hypothetical protein [Bacillota bacterium]